MSLIEILKNTPEQVENKHVQQLISFAGEGKLKDNSKASTEFREFLSSISTEQITRYVNECLNTKFDDNGFALQDLINEIGCRLGFKVNSGRYRGVKGSNGFDGHWEAPEGNHIVVEVKTSDAYRLGLNKIANYRRDLINNKISGEQVSILVVVGREETGDLEAQIRGSKHAWDIRLISVDAIMRLLSIKEELEDPTNEEQIRAILIPREYTRLDEIIDLIFSTAEDIKQDEAGLTEKVEGKKDSKIQDNFKEACVKDVSKYLEVSLIKRSRALFSTSDKKTAVLIVISKEYDHRSNPNYWFAFHSHQHERLEKVDNSYVAFGCGSPDKIILIPFFEFKPYLSGMSQTKKENGKFYWHVQIYDEDGKFILNRKKGTISHDLTKFLVRENKQL